MPPKTPDQSPARPVHYEFIQGLDHKRPPIKLPAPDTVARWVELLLQLAGSRVAIDRAAFLARLSPAPATTADGKPAFETRHFSQLMTLLVHELPLPALGVRMGAMSKLTDLGTFGYALHSSKNLRELFSTARRYQTLAGYTGLNVHYTPQRLVLQFPDQAAIEHRCLIEDWMFSLWSGIADLLPYITEMQQAELSFVYPEPSYADEMYRYFPGKIHFAAARNLLTLPLAWVDTPLLSYDADTQAAVLRACEKQLAACRHEASTRTRLQHWLEGAILCSTPTLQQAAQELHLAPSTLQAHLRDEQTSFSALLEQVRMAYACAELRQGVLSIEQIAAQLGYGERVSFFRAFKRYTGKTPRQFAREADS
ncbi:helix-turn-helix domain-containing protein [Vogesella sp. GCM10023246]|uniref:AraC family transcriptional regulator ligand-binding domain-containing protein n=1 Tax=Vogesella oryzagri TaxID=3160864 RepID=A0ABV1M9W0_9NEIS